MFKSVLAGMLVLVGSAVVAQKKSTDPVIMTIDGKPVHKSEFEAIFKKNYKKPQVDRADLEEYIDLFVKFRLKVAEAERLGMDTAKKFRTELDGYRKQLAKPYLVDRDMNQSLIKEGYDRMKTEVRASHILIRVGPDAAPADTLIAWNKIMEIRKRILAGEDFGEVAAAKKGSEDPSAAKNKGDLGYFTAFQMVYPFESAAYALKLNDISMPVRTQYGYHLIKKTGERPALGEIRASHILVRVDKTADEATRKQAEDRIREIHGKLKSGEDFSVLAQRFSEDKGSAGKGGELPWFGTGKMVPEFEEQAFALKADNEFSEPFQSDFGWHIVKRLELKTLGTFEELEPQIKQKVQRDVRSQKSRTSFIAKLKKIHKFKDLSAKQMPAIRASLDTTIYLGEWDTTKVTNRDAILFQFAGGKVKVADFARFIYNTQRKQKPDQGIDKFLTLRYNEFVEQRLMNYEDGLLEQKYPEFRLLVKEYRDGILLFELTDKMVWTKAVKDSTGLAAFFEAHRSEFMWEERADADIFWCSDNATGKKVAEMLGSGVSVDSIRTMMNKESALNVRTETGKFERSKQGWLFGGDNVATVIGPVEVEGKTGVARVREFLPAATKELKDARGMVIARYQDHLENAWITELKARYKVLVNEDVLYSIK
jgi:peptidyl-prolyl cis-trans isomerase SurA